MVIEEIVATPHTMARPDWPQTFSLVWAWRRPILS